ncbi:MAG TPA: DUF3826 domain-containing protein [Verrucomicrobiae bacterium]|nr:DUF3826 domain-containing protein [Verrucomicrobiae bacterium]
MKAIYLCAAIFMAANFTPSLGAAESSNSTIATRAQLDPAIVKKASEWVATLQLTDPGKEERVTQAIAAHLQAVRDWHNSHPYTEVPETNSVTGKPMSVLEREMVADSRMPKTAHEKLMTALRKDLNDQQVAAILDKYTVGKVEFTMRGYEGIVPDMTPAERATILHNLEQAREEAIDYKDMKEISAVFKKYKTKNEQYLDANGRDWHALYKAYVQKIEAEKKAKTEK